MLPLDMTQITLRRTGFAGWLLLQGWPLLTLTCVQHVASAASGGGHTIEASQAHPDVEKRDAAIHYLEGLGCTVNRMEGDVVAG